MQYFVVDAFAERLFEGNQAGVCLLDSWPKAGVMQSIAAENNLAETAFVCKEGGGYRLHWFTPEQEFDLCGHATLATAFVLANFVDTSAEVFRFETMSGPLAVTKREPYYELDFPARPGRPIEVTPLMSQALGAPVLEAYLARDMMLVVEDEETLQHLQPDLELVARLPDCVNLIVTAKGDSADFVSRYFTPGISIPEDPVTGSAHCTLIPYWAGRLSKQKMTARQLSHRGGQLCCENRGDRVGIAGKAVLYLRGEIGIGGINS